MITQPTLRKESTVAHFLNQTALSDFRLRHSIGGVKIGRRITSLPVSELMKFVSASSFSLGGSKAWKANFSRSLIRWVDQSTNHEHTTEELLTLICRGGFPMTTQRLLGASRLCGALGLHVVALKLETQAWDLIRGREAKARHPSELLQQVQVAIYRGDLQQAKDFSQKLCDRLAPKDAGLFSYTDVFNYISLWSGNESLRFPGESESLSHRWNSELAGRRLHVYGPGVTTGNVTPIPSDEKVIRIAGPGSYAWSNKQDLAQGRTNIVYLIPETLAQIGKSEKDRQKILGGYDFVRVKRAEVPYLENALKVEAGSRLFLRGHPNMVPLICLDVLRVKETSLKIIGSDFFASPVSYRRDSRRTSSPGNLQDPKGSGGNPYDRSTLMASHNVFENRALVKNLYEAGKIEGDTSFNEALEMTHSEYAEILDEIYGKERS